jgi:selenide, water dikinase
MAELNKGASRAMSAAGATGCTDITGFGLIGHAAEMAAASSVSIHIDAAAVPLIPGVLEYAAMGMVPAGSYRNRKHAGKQMEKRVQVDEALEDVLFDPQTSGGLLIALPIARLDFLKARMAEEKAEPPQVIGYAAAENPGMIYIV